MQRMIGIYNLTWAGGSALAYFTGGAIVERLGMRSIFWLPIAMHAAQLLMLLAFHGRANRTRLGYLAESPKTESPIAPELNPRPIARVKLFLRLAWIANPLAYVAINSLVAVIPDLAGTLHLSPMFAGFFCSVWFFARWFTFLALWLWPGWHYRAGWFFGAFGVLIASYMLILLVPHIAAVIAAQVAFGMAVGLIYYSSLYYSMDAGGAKSTHSGVHEAALGFGIFLGPAVGATTLRLLPNSPNSGTVAVSALLVAGLVTLLCFWRDGALRRGRRF
jgi:predicted MFS family arabinose efflux permease